MKYRNVTFEYVEWTTWNDILKTGYNCSDKKLLDGLDTLSFGAPTIKEMEERIDDLLDFNEQHRHSQQLTNNAMDEFMDRYYY